MATPTELSLELRTVGANIAGEVTVDGTIVAAVGASVTAVRSSAARLTAIGGLKPSQAKKVKAEVTALLGECTKLDTQRTNLITSAGVLSAQRDTIVRVAGEVDALDDTPPVEPPVEPPIEPPPVTPGTGLLADVFAAGARTLLFDDVFTDGMRAAAQNGVSWAGVNLGSEEAVAVVADPTNVSGYVLGFTYGGNPSLPDDGWAEQRVKFPNLTECYIGMEVGVPDNYVHREPGGADNNKLLRLFDMQYNPSMVHLGMSTLHKPGTTPGRSQMIVEFANSQQGGFTGNYATGPWNLVFTPGAVERVVFRHKVASGIGVADGIIQVWWNGALVYDLSDLATTKACEGGVNAIVNGYLFGWSNSGFTETTTMRLRQFIVAAP